MEIFNLLLILFKFIKSTINIFQDFMDDYNIVYCKDVHIDFFIDAIEHTLRLTRLLRGERGNGLMVGVSGMGRQTLTRLASHVNGYK